MKRTLFFVIFLLLTMTACGLFYSSPSTSEIQATVDVAIAQTQTARESPTSTSEPSYAPTPEQRTILSSKIRDAIHLPPADGAIHVFGILYFSNEPIINITDEIPSFRLDISGSGDRFPSDQIIYDKSTGEYLIINLPVEACKTGCWIATSIEKTPPPGGYEDYKFFSSDDLNHPISRLDLYLARVMHLTSPIDNAQIVNFDLSSDNFPTYGKEGFIIRWDPIAEAKQYKILIYTDQTEPWTIQSPVSYTTNDPSFTISSLSPSLDNQHYDLRISALDENGHEVGSLRVQYSDSLTPGFFFRIK